MKEIKDIINAFNEAQKEGVQTSLATVVHVKGSSYRKPGARMLITEYGQLTGAISGGCLEGDALRKALLVMKQQKPLLVTYDTTDEDDAKLGMGLGCDGIIQVLIEPIDSSDPNNPVFFLKSILEERQKAVLVTLFSIENKKDFQYGTCILIKENGKTINATPVLKEILLADAKQALISQTTSFKNYISESRNITAFIEVLKPEVSLIVIGAGNDAIPLVKMADILGWETTVADGRPNYAKQGRFTKSTRIIVSKPENVLEQLIIAMNKQYLY
jgi:xanthine dehydrogenase accessory factor